MEFEYQTLTPELSLWCLEQQLYKQAPNFNSRMKNIYLGEKDLSVLAIIAKQNQVACGIILCEINENKQQAFTLKDSMRKNSAIAQHYDWHIHSLGFLSIYIQPEFRQQGLATELLKKMELWRISQISASADDIFVFQAREKSYDLANTHLVYSYPTELSPNSANYRFFISDLAKAIEYDRKGWEMDKIFIRETYSASSKKLKF